MNGKKTKMKYVQGRVKEETFNEFREISIKLHGPKHGHTGKALQEALEMFVNRYRGDL